jgi:hypothetical protein
LALPQRFSLLQFAYEYFDERVDTSRQDDSMRYARFE